jgi:hypothetical protein
MKPSPNETEQGFLTGSQVTGFAEFIQKPSLEKLLFWFVE